MFTIVCVALVSGDTTYHFQGFEVSAGFCAESKRDGSTSPVMEGFQSISESFPMLARSFGSNEGNAAVDALLEPVFPPRL